MTIDKEVEVVFDRFGKLDFEERIIQSVQTCNGVREIKAKDSQLVHGLQFADNVCSVLRMEKAGTDLFGYYDIIADKVIEV